MERNIAECEDECVSDADCTRQRAFYRDGEWIFAAKDCSYDAAPCGYPKVKPWENIFGPIIGPGDQYTGDGTRCNGGERGDCDADSCALAIEDICCCADRSGFDSCAADLGETADAVCAVEGAMAAHKWDVCPTGVVDKVWTVADADFTTRPNAALEALRRLNPFFRAVNAGNVTIGSTACEMLIFNPRNTGNFAIAGGAETHVVIIDAVNAAEAGSSLAFTGGSARLLGGSNAGPGPIYFVTGGAVEVFGLTNAGDVVFVQSQDVSVMPTHNTGRIAARNTSTSIYNVTNSGNITIQGGAHAIYDVVNSGVIVAAGVTVALSNVVNSGTVYVVDGSVALVGGANTGRVVPENLSSLVIDLAHNAGDVYVENCAGIDIRLGDNTGGRIDLSHPGNSGTIVVTLTEGASEGVIVVGDGVTLTVVTATAAPTAEPTAAPTLRPTVSPAPTPKPTSGAVVASSFTVDGTTVAEAEVNAAVYAEAIASTAGVEAAAVAVSFSAARRRLLTGSVVVDYRILVRDPAAAALIATLEATTAEILTTAVAVAAASSPSFGTITVSAVAAVETYATTDAPTTGPYIDAASRRAGGLVGASLAAAALCLL
ncbi:hypothetical protein M885DRAFT_30462 [Pelagophyceae sp. CCMP2097]|nr:hypothetical protein M885DRAFT_30462 [Pelagophyceae sp. CCMP2097]